MDINELNKFVVQGSIDEELIREQDESLNPKSISEKEVKMDIDLNNAIRTVLAEALLKENQFAASFPPSPTKPGADKVDPKVKNSLALIRVIQENLWKIGNQNFNFDGGELDSDITDLIGSLTSPIIKLAVAKLYHLWYSEAPVAKVEVEVEKVDDDVKEGDEVVSPQGTEYKVEAISNGIISLNNKVSGKATIAEGDIKKWRRK